LSTVPYYGIIPAGLTKVGKKAIKEGKRKKRKRKSAEREREREREDSPPKSRRNPRNNKKYR